MTRKLVMLLILTAVATTAFGKKSPPITSQNGALIQRACTNALDATYYHPRKIKKRREVFDFGYCLGLVTGVYQNLNSEVDFCPGENPSERLIWENVVSFVKQHPELKDKDSADIVRWSLENAFPCPGTDLGNDTESKLDKYPSH